MNKILFLKGLVGVLTLLIFLAMGGIVYALINYKTTPKLIPRSQMPQTVQNVQNLSLNQDKNTVLKDVSACGAALCVSVSNPFEGDKIAVIDPQKKTVLYWISIRGESPQ